MSNRQILCKLADGTTITLDKKIVLPIKFNNITIEADLFILPMNHVRIIIGCDLLHLLNARIDFSSNTLMLQKPLPITKIACLQHNSLGHLEVTRQDTHTTPKSHVSELEDRVKRIDIHKSNITSTQKSDIVHLLNNYTDIFATDLFDIGRTNILQYDIEIPRDTKPIHLPQYKYAYQYRNTINEEVKKLIDSGLAELAPDGVHLFGPPVDLDPQIDLDPQLT